MEAKELREMTADELKRKLEELKKEYLNIRFQSFLGDVRRRSVIIILKKDIARILTVLREKGVKL